MYSDPYEKFIHRPVERRPAIAPLVPRERVRPERGKQETVPWNKEPGVMELLKQYRLVVSIAGLGVTRENPGARPKVKKRPKASPKLMKLIVMVSRVSGLPVIEIISQRKSAPSAKARQIAVWLARKFTVLSLPNIGRHLGGRDHTTVLHSLNRVDFAVADLRLAGPSDDPAAWAALLWGSEWPPLAGRDRRSRRGTQQ